MATPPAHSHSSRWRGPSQGPAVQGGFLPTASTPMWGAFLGLGVCSDGEQRAVVPADSGVTTRHRGTSSMRATRRTRGARAACVSRFGGHWGPLAPVCPASLTCSRNHATATRCVATVSGQQTLHDDKPTRGLHTGATADAREGGGRRQPRRHGRRRRRSARRACRARVICLGRRRAGADGPAAAAGPAGGGGVLPTNRASNQVLGTPILSTRHVGFSPTSYI